MGLRSELEAASRLVEAARKYRSQDDLAALMKKQTKRMVKLAQADVSSDGDVAEFLEALCASPFVADQQQELAAAALSKQVDTKVEQVSGGAGRSYYMQHCSAFQNYLTGEQWVELRNEQLTVETKIAIIMQRCVAVGLLMPSETTRRHLLAVALALDGKHFRAEDALRGLESQTASLTKTHIGSAYLNSSR